MSVVLTDLTPIPISTHSPTTKCYPDNPPFFQVTKKKNYLSAIRYSGIV